MTRKRTLLNGVWWLSDEQQVDPFHIPEAVCLDCGKPYGEFGLDTTLSNEQWELIHPDKNGLLCVQCIVNRAEKLPGIIKVNLKLEINQFESENEDDFNDEPEPCPTCGDIDGMVNPCCSGYDPLHYKNCGYG